ncbi:hypothetical protein A4R44_04602 [Amycolatopsis sp. M39]|nr:hypothetical protein A4R44_04602 [Amycolatopsis sp. M39]
MDLGNLCPQGAQVDVLGLLPRLGYVLCRRKRSHDGWCTLTPLDEPVMFEH